MLRKTLFVLVLTLLLNSMLASTVVVQLSRAEEAVHVESDVGGLWLAATDWNKTYGGTNDDLGYDLVQTDDGGYALAGYTQSYGAGGNDAWLVKADSVGNAQWNETYGGTGLDIAVSSVQTSDGGYALAGYTNSTGAGGSDFWLIKLTPITVYIRADGSVDPPTAPIQRNGNFYTLTDDISSVANGIVIERNNITLDGAGYTIQGARGMSSRGIQLHERSNVTIKNIEVKAFYYGIVGDFSSNSTISGNSTRAVLVKLLL